VNQLHPLSLLNRSLQVLEEEILQTNEVLPRTIGVTRSLREAWPRACQYACVLPGSSPTPIVVLDGNGSRCDDWEHKLDRVPAGENLASAWSRELSVSRHSAIVHPLTIPSLRAGAIALVFPSSIGKEEVELAREYMGCYTRMLVTALEAESCRVACEGLQQDIQALERMAHRGELAGPMGHEFTNFLNVLLLQVAVLKYQMPETYHADLAEITRQGTLAVEVVNQFHQTMRPEAPPEAILDLRELVAEAIEELRSIAPVDSSLVLQQAPDQLPIGGMRTDIKRLVRLLVSNAIRAGAQTNQPVSVHTEEKETAIILRVEDGGSTPSEKALLHIFDLSQPAREGVNALELAACNSLARRLNARIRAEARPEGGLCIVVEFKSFR
jgi:signal transduction histidine kinase